MSFSPSGITDDPEIRTATSLIDYMAKRLALSYLSFDDRLELGLASIDDMPEAQTSLEVDPEPKQPAVSDVSTNTEIREVETNVANNATPVVEKTPGPAVDTAPLCFNCGNQTQRSGSCYVCSSCGSTTGCS